MDMDAIILAAGQGSRLRGYWNKPKGLIILEGETLIERSVRILKLSGISHIFIVVGYEAQEYEKLFAHRKDITLIYNPIYYKTQSAYSLSYLKNFIHSDCIILDSDIIYCKNAISTILSFPKREAELYISEEINIQDNIYVSENNGILYELSRNKTEMKKISGELVYICKITSEYFHNILPFLTKTGNSEYIMHAQSNKYPVSVQYIEKLVWCEIDTLEQLQYAKTHIVPKLKNNKSF